MGDTLVSPGIETARLNCAMRNEGNSRAAPIYANKLDKCAEMKIKTIPVPVRSTAVATLQMSLPDGDMDVS